MFIIMKRLVTLLFVFAALLPLRAATADYEVVPLPSEIIPQKGNPFVLNDAVQIAYGEGLQREAEFLKEYIAQLTGLQLTLANSKKVKNAIRLAINPKLTLGEEGYRLTVGQKGVLIESVSAKGVFYGIQTLRKSLAAGKVTELPAVVINDEPRFGYRGAHLDCSRGPAQSKCVPLASHRRPRVAHRNQTLSAAHRGWFEAQAHRDRP